MLDQLSLFTKQEYQSAIYCFDGTPVKLQKPEPWMLDTVPEGEYMVMVGKHPHILKPTNLTLDSIPKSHEFYHYGIGNRIYVGVFID